MYAFLNVPGHIYIAVHIIAGEFFVVYEGRQSCKTIFVTFTHPIRQSWKRMGPSRTWFSALKGRCEFVSLRPSTCCLCSLSVLCIGWIDTRLETWDGAFMPKLWQNTIRLPKLNNNFELSLHILGLWKNKKNKKSTKMQLMLSEFWRSDFIVYIVVFVDLQLRILKRWGWWQEQNGSWEILFKKINKKDRRLSPSLSAETLKFWTDP